MTNDSHLSSFLPYPLASFQIFDHPWIAKLHHVSSPTFLISGFLLYLLVVRLLRYRMQSYLASLYDADRSKWPSMPISTAQNILLKLSSREFPFTFQKALEFALFRTYGIPSISKLLVKTAQFANPATAPKRYSDTSVLVVTMILRDWGSKDWVRGVSRINCLHNEYRSKGLITNDDMLYTLSLFALEPVRWIQRHEWRPLTELEKCALGVFWKSMGDAMDISYDELPSNSKWQDGLEWLEQMDKWSEAYEKKYMVPDDNNYQTAQQTTSILLYTVPKPMKPFAFQSVCALMDDRLRRAMKYPDPPKTVQTMIDSLLAFRAILIRHAFLPRPHFMRHVTITTEPDVNGRYFLTEYDAMPYYVKPTFFNRWGLGAMLRKMQGIPVPGDAKFFPEGYHTVDVGPRIGKKGQGTMEQRVMDIGGRCPMAFGR